MPKLRDYACACGTRFEYLHMAADNVATCPDCARVAEDRDEVLGGRLFTTIVPMSRSSLKNKAGYVHTHGDRPAEKISVAVPRSSGDGT